MRPLHWTVVATAIPAGGSLGGVVRYTSELIRALAEREDVVVSAVTTRAAADTVAELVGGGRVSTVPNAPVPLLSIAERHLRLSGRGQAPDVIQGVKHLVPARSRALRVLTVHDMLLLDRAEDFGRGKRLLLPPFYRSSIADAELLLCVSEATRQRLLAWAPAVAGRAEVVPLATSATLRAIAPEPVESLRGRAFALVVGDSSPRKNLATLLEAWPAVLAELPGAVLAIAGPPSWGATEVGLRYDALVAAGSVRPLGHLSEAGLKWAYQHAAVVACPSLAEGFGLPAAEALDLGAPVLISDDPALVEGAAGRAQAVLPARDAGRWAAAVLAAVRQPAPVRPESGRSWAEVAEETVAAVVRAMHRRPTRTGR